jgi:hypothetical protein
LHSQVRKLKICLCSLLIRAFVSAAASETVSIYIIALVYSNHLPRLRHFLRYLCSFLLWYSIQRYKPKRKQTLIESLAKIDSLNSMIDQHYLTWTLFCVKHSGGTLQLHWVRAPFHFSFTSSDVILRHPTRNNDQRHLQRLFYS